MQSDKYELRYLPVFSEDLNDILAKKKMFKRKREAEKRKNFKPARQEQEEDEPED